MKSSISIYSHSLIFILSFFISTIGRAQTQNCDATTLDHFYECYGGRAAFSEQSQAALSTFIQAEDAITSGNYSKAKTLIDDLFDEYPIGDASWKNLRTRINGSNTGSPHGYYGLRMMDEIATHHLSQSNTVAAKKINMKVVLLGCSEGIEPTNDEELANGTGNFVTHTLDPRVRADNYRLAKQSYELFGKYITAISDGKLQLEVEFIELPDYCLPVSVSTSAPYLGYAATTPPVWKTLGDEVSNATDWWWVLYPSHAPDYPDFHDNHFITGGLGLDNKGGPVFTSDDQWIIRKPFHHGGGDYSDIERRLYMPMWFQHEFFHHLFLRSYPDYKLEVDGHDWFDRDFWPADFEGLFENDYYAEALHKRFKTDCIPLETKLITSTNQYSSDAFTSIAMDELVGTYSQDNIVNGWHSGEIIKVDGKFYWKNNADVKWNITLNPATGILETGVYPDYNIALYFDPNTNEYIPGVIGLMHGNSILRKRFDMLNNNTIPFEITLGAYASGSTSGEIIKESGTIFWKTEQGDKWTLTPNTSDESFVLGADSSTPGNKFELISQNNGCGYEIVGFNYLGNQYLRADDGTVSSGVNLARSGTASQSSNYSNTSGLAQLAIDGNTNGAWDQSSLTHTNTEYRPWWQVRLEKDHAIGELKIWNRTDCCANRLSNFDVFIYNEAGDLMYKKTIVDAPNSVVTLDVKGAIGNRVRIKLKDTNSLSLAEVQIYGTSSSAAPIGSTIAFRKSGGDGLWVTAEKYGNDNQLLARGTGIYDWEKFVVEAHPLGGIALKSNATGKYVQVQDDDNTKPVRATGNTMRTWEQFQWQDMGDNQMALKSMHTGKWLQASWKTDRAVLYPNGAAAKTWETFGYTIVNTANKSITTTAPQDFTIHPVPTSAAITISGTLNDRNTMLEIVDLKGGLLLRKHLDQNQTTIDISTFESGMYIARFYTGDESNQILKIIKN